MKVATNVTRSVIILWLFCFSTTIVASMTSASGALAYTFLIVSSITQANLFCMPLMLLVIIQSKYAHIEIPSKIGEQAIYWLGFGTILFFIANFKLHSLYGFYMNYFVWNLLSTPGGVEAMGVSDSTYSTLTLSVFGLLALYLIALFAFPLEKLFPQNLKTRNTVYAMVSLFVIQAGMYAYADYRYHQPILQVADKQIWYLPVTAKSIMSDLGFVRSEAAITVAGGVNQSSGDLNYHNVSANQLTTTNKYNIIWLVAESWRADMVTPEIMPNTYQFALENNWFQNHYSGGNGTRMGMFTQFYGLYGSYWFDFLNAQRPPLLMDVLEHEKYNSMAYTSSAFTYPEFDKTIFSRFPESSLQAYSEGEGWERDRKNTGDLISFIEDVESPFFTFMFFESAHANYYFPEEDIIDGSYIEDFNYITLDIEENIERIRARYINAVHHLDSQLARVFTALEENQLMENTIVVVTGDHGEEFFEKGRWGHNSTFSQEQIRVPLILHMPKQSNSTYTKITSHIDIPATILAALGNTVDGEQYSYGENLFSNDFQRDYVIVSDWHGNALVTPEVKVNFSSKSALYGGNFTSLDDQLIDPEKQSESYLGSLTTFTQELSRFYR